MMLICWALIEDYSANIQDSPKDESSVLKAVQNVHAMIDKEIAAGTDPNNVFVCGFSQGGFSFALPPSSIPHHPPKKNRHAQQNIFAFIDFH